MQQKFGIYDFVDKKSNEEYIESIQLKFKNQEELYKSFHDNLFNIISSIEDDTCKEIVEQMEQFKNIFIYINELTSDFGNLMEVVEEITEKIQRKKQKIQNLKTENDAMKHEIEDLTLQTTKMENDYNILSQDYLKLFSISSNCKPRKESSSSLSQSLSEFNGSKKENKNKNQEEIRNKEINEIIELKNENEKLTKDITSLKNNISSLDKEKYELKLKCSKIQTEINEKYILRTLSDFQILKFQKEIDNLQIKIKNLSIENESLQAENENLIMELKNLTTNKREPTNYQNNINTTTVSTQGNAYRNCNTVLEDDNLSIDESNNYLNTIDLGKELGEEEDNENNKEINTKIQITPNKIIKKMNDNKFDHLLCEKCKQSLSIQKENEKYINDLSELSNNNNSISISERLYLFDLFNS